MRKGSEDAFSVLLPPLRKRGSTPATTHSEDAFSVLPRPFGGISEGGLPLCGNICSEGVPLAKERWYTGDYEQNGSEGCVETKLILKEELP